MSQPAGPARVLADALRAKGGVENRTAVWDGERVEIFRGKDLVRWVAANPDACSRFFTPDKSEEERARQVGQSLLRAGLLRRTERKYKTPPPGSKKLIKFPRKLADPAPSDAGAFAVDGFYAWAYDRPTSPWTVVWAALAVLGALGACLFPMAPNWVKLVVLYVSSSLLTLILALLLTRVVVAGGSWILTGSALWLLPNIMQEVPFSQLLRPLYSVEPPAEGSKWGSHPAVRAAVAVAVGAVVFVLHAHGPKKDSVVKEAARYRDDIFEFLNMRDYKVLTNGTDATANTTAGGNATHAEL